MEKKENLNRKEFFIPVSISSSLQPDTWGRLSQLPWVDQCFLPKTGRGIPLLTPAPVSCASSAGLHAFPKLATSQNSSRNTMGGMADDVLGGFLCRWELHCGGLDTASWALPGKMWDSGDERPRFGSPLHSQPCGCPSWGPTWLPLPTATLRAGNSLARHGEMRIWCSGMRDGGRREHRRAALLQHFK